MFKNLTIKTILLSGILFIIPYFVFADYQGQKVNFFVDSSYDLLGREQITASLVYITPKIYFYIEDDWWNIQNEIQKQEFSNALNDLSLEFLNKIYPTLTSTFGSEWNPGIDGDSHITVLLHQIRKDAGGYFNNGNEYPKIQYPLSNEREMVYLNTEHIKTSQAKSFLAHEFQHLITYNQKEKLFNVSEDIWLNEARSEYASTLLGYDSVYEGSNLQRRVKSFLEKPNDSLTEWQGKTYDYGVLNLFTQYLVDHYGVKILVDSLKMRETGIESLNKTLNQEGASEDFSQVFTNWTITILINDCSLGEKYCYKNENLKKIQVIPSTNFLPLTGQSSLQVIKLTKTWAGNWEKFVGGKGNLKFEFEGVQDTNFKVPYIIGDSAGKLSINFLKLDALQKGTLFISDFSTKNVSLMIVPSIQSKTSDFTENEPFYQFTYKVSIVGAEEVPSQEEAKNIENLLAQIEYLKKEIARLQSLLSAGKPKISCQKFENNLYFGITNNSEVRCLQEFLKSKGDSIYPEGLVTGNYFSATLSAVKKYQTSKGIISTGYFGPLTRTAVNNELIKSY